MTNTGLRTALLVLLISGVAPADDAHVQVLCSNGFRAALDKLLPEAQRTIGHPVNVKFGTSASFKQAIEGGEQFDLVIVTPQIIGDLIKDGKIAAGTQVNLASTGEGMAIRTGQPKPDVSSAQAMKQTLLQLKSIGVVKVGAGTPAVVDMLNRLGITEQVQPKIVYQEGADQSMANLASGKVEAAFGLISEVASVPGVQFAGPLPAEFQRKIFMTAGISGAAKNRKAAEGIIQSFTNAASAEAITAANLEPASKGK
ncbi:MAG TPA: substrate-binding domain-containing protein [Bryobacteraceae bacterium]|nr:substrate-binding domain-containing protein [Bryobacteraceae bacterium]